MDGIPPFDSPEYLEWEAAGTAVSAAARAKLFHDDRPFARTRDIQVSSSASRRQSKATGSGYVSRRPPATQRRYEKLIRVEGQSTADEDYTLLVSGACAILEEELQNLLVKPAAAIGDRLVTAVAMKDRNRADMLARWAARPGDATLGTASLVLLGLRRALEQHDSVVTEFLAATFTTGLIEHIQSNEAAKSCDRVREQFRNKACHALSAFPASEYETCAHLLVGNRRIGAWEREGPAPNPPADDSGLLHHMLAGANALPAVELPPAQRPLELLSALTLPRDSSLEIKLVPTRPADAAVWRDISISAARKERPFRLGDTIRFAFQCNRDVFVTLIDAGTSGRMQIVVPNAWCPEARICGGRWSQFPGPDFAEFDMTLEGAPGRERVFALATLTPPAVALAPEGDAAIRVIDATQVDALIRWIKGLDPESWAACACEFTIEP